MNKKVIIGIAVIVLLAGGIILGRNIINQKNNDVIITEKEDNQNDQTSIVSENEEKTEENNEEVKYLEVDSSVVKNAHKIIPTLRQNEIMGKTAYQDKKVTINDLSNEVKLRNIFDNVDWSKEEQKPINPGEGIDWFKFDESIINKYTKKLYGESANIKQESFDITLSSSCNYDKDNKEYSYGYGGEDLLLNTFTKVVQAYTKGDSLYIKDKFLLVKVNNFDSNDLFVYNSTIDIDAIAKISKQEYWDNSNNETYFLSKYENQLGEYLHTFKKNSDGTYYWVSTEPVK